MEVFYNIVSLLGGLALFLYGMRIMGNGLKSSSGGALKAGLAKVTGNPAIGFIFGMLVTCMIQSSTATIVLTVGLVGAGFMSYRQSVGVILGANVGTAITAQIIRLMDLDAGSGSLLNFFKSDNLAPMALIIGIILIMFVGSRAADSVGTIFMGFGILFVGLMNMSAAVGKMGNSLSSLLVRFEDNYFFGFLAGVVVTGVIQSSSAVVGILQTLASSFAKTGTGALTFAGVFAVIVGVNIGDCITTFLVCRIGAKPEQIRTCLVHIIYNVCAAVLVFASVGILRGTGVLNDDIWFRTLNSGGVANIHGIFRLVPAIVLLPVSGLFANLAEKLVPDKELDPEDAEIEKNLRELDMRLISNPALALTESAHLIVHMAETAGHNFEAAYKQLMDYDPKRKERIMQREDLLDRMTDACNQFVVAVSPNITLESDSRNQNFQLKALVCFERIGDLAVNISDAVEKMREKKTEFSPQAMSEIKVAFDAVREIIALSHEACRYDSNKTAQRIEPLEEVIDELIETLNNSHNERVKKNLCTIENGIEFQNILQNLERTADQCSDLGVYFLGKTDNNINGNEHRHLHELHHSDDRFYKEWFQKNYDRYFGEMKVVERLNQDRQ